jgi:hypothetical protein
VAMRFGKLSQRVDFKNSLGASYFWGWNLQWSGIWKKIRGWKRLLVDIQF